MDINIIDKQISNIKYYQSIKETLYPEEKLKKDQEFLKGFLWQEDIKPTRAEF
mgnify:FL=1